MTSVNRGRGWIADLELHPQTTIDRWRDGGWWQDETFAEFIRERFSVHADHTAIIGYSASDYADPQARRAAAVRVLNYRELDHLSMRLAAVLATRDIRAGDPVILHLPNTVEFPVALAALFRLGALPVCALHSHREPALEAMAAASGSTSVLTAPEPRPLQLGSHGTPESKARTTEPALRLVDVSELLSAADVEKLTDLAVPTPQLDPSRAGLVQLSGGTTGESKLIPRSHAGYLYSVRESARICGLSHKSRLMVTVPASHNFPMSSPGILGAFHAGAAVVMAPDPSPATAFALIDEHRVSHLSLVPPLARAYVEAARIRGYRPTSIEVIGVGGARLAETVAAEIEPALGGRLQQVFGMAEGLVNYTRLGDPYDVILATQGRPLSPADEIRVVTAEGEVASPGEEGELQTRGPYTITRYLGQSQREQDSFTKDGFYRTGDLVFRRPDGNIVVTGRAGDCINRAGEKISASDVEDLVLGHPGVLEAVAVGVPDTHLGEALVLAVTLRETHPVIPDLRAHLISLRVPKHWLPDRVVVLPAMPTTGVGKNSRRELREKVAAGLGADPRSATSS